MTRIDARPPMDLPTEFGVECGRSGVDAANEGSFSKSLLPPTEDPGGIPDSVGAPLHVVTENRMWSANGIPVPG